MIDDVSPGIFVRTRGIITTITLLTLFMGVMSVPASASSLVEVADETYGFFPFVSEPDVWALLDDLSTLYTPLTSNEKRAVASVDTTRRKEPANVKRTVSGFLRTRPVVATAYSSTIDQTDGDPCTTASGLNVCKHNRQNILAANFLPLGTRVRLPELYGGKVFIIHDRMNARYRNGRVDIWMRTRQDARAFGVKRSTLEIVEDHLAADIH